MLTISEIREKYPSYKDLSDSELADKLHSKFYSDIPKDDFYNKIGLDVNKDDLKSNAINRFNIATGAQRTPIDTARDLTAGVISGLGKGGQLIASALTGGYAPKVDFDQLTSSIASPNKSIGGQVTQGIGSYLPYGAAGGASFLGQTLAGGASGAANTGSDESNLLGYLPSGKIGGGIEGALLNALTHGAFAGAEALRPSKMFRGNLSPEQLQRNVNITKGTETGLGDVIQSPYLKRRLENTLTNVPFSGANESLQRTGNLVVDRGQDLLSKMLGDNDSANVPQKISDELSNQFEIHQDKKNALYDSANKMADDANLKLEMPTFAKKAADYSAAIDSTNMLKYEPDMQKIFNKLQNYKNPLKKSRNVGSILDTSGNPLIDETTTTYPRLEEANLLKGRLNHYSNVAAQSPDPTQRGLAGIFSDLSSALKTDINSSIEKSGNVALKSEYGNAENNYAKNFSPFLDKQIYKYVSGNKDPETIVSNFIKTSSATDLAGHLGKLASKLPDQSKPLLGYSYFSRALDNEGNLNPAKLGTLYSKLGKNQLKTLVPDQAMRKALSDYVKLQGMNKEAQYLMFNPKTGQRNTDALVTGLLGLGGHLATGNIAGALTAIGLPVLAGKLSTNALTSPEFREALVDAMIKNKSWNSKNLQSLQAGAQGLVNR